MATTLIQQSTRADDERFRSQVRAALMRDLPNLLVATLGGTYAPGADANAQAQNAGRAQAFARRIVEERERVVQQVAQAVAGEPAIVALDLASNPVLPATVGEIASASEALLIARVRVIVRALAGIV